MAPRHKTIGRMLANSPSIADLLLRMPGARPVLYVPITEHDIEDVRGQLEPREASDIDLVRLAFDRTLIDEGLAPFARPIFESELQLFHPSVEPVHCVVVDFDSEEDVIMRFLLEQLPAGFDYTRGQVLVVPPMPDARYLS